MKTLGTMVVALVLGLGYGGLATADPQPPQKAAEKNAAGELTDVQLGELLTGMGLDPKQGTYKSGAHYYDVTLKTADYDLRVRLGLSPNKRSIWLMAYLGDLPADVPAERLRDLLQAVNSKTGKMQFRMTGNQLKADQPLDNVGVTASRLRRELDDFADSLQNTGKLWDTTKWETKTAGKDEKAAGDGK